MLLQFDVDVGAVVVEDGTVVVTTVVDVGAVDVVAGEVVVDEE